MRKALYATSLYLITCLASTTVNGWQECIDSPGCIIRNEGSGRCVDVDSSSNNTPALGDCGSARRWIYVPDLGQISTNTSLQLKCLDTQAGGSVVSASVWMANCNAILGQKFTINNSSNGPIISALATDVQLCLAPVVTANITSSQATNNTLQVAKCEPNNTNQMWSWEIPPRSTGYKTDFNIFFNLPALFVMTILVNLVF